MCVGTTIRFITKVLGRSGGVQEGIVIFTILGGCTLKPKHLNWFSLSGVQPGYIEGSRMRSSRKLQGSLHELQGLGFKVEGTPKST